MAPCGRFCSSRDDAIKYMLKEGIYDEEEIEAMQAGFGEDTDYDDITAGGWGHEMEEDGSPVRSIQERKSPPKFYGDWAVKDAKAVKRKRDSSLEEESDDDGKKLKTEVVDGFTVVKEEPSSDDEQPTTNNEQFKVLPFSEDADDKDFVPKVRITKVKTENVADDDCFHLR